VTGCRIYCHDADGSAGKIECQSQQGIGNHEVSCLACQQHLVAVDVCGPRAQGGSGADATGVQSQEAGSEVQADHVDCGEQPEHAIVSVESATLDGPAR